MTKIVLPRTLKLLPTLLAVVIAGLAVFGQETPPFSLNNSPLPEPTGFVNDFAGVIDAAIKQQIEAKLQDLKDTTNPSVEIAVAVVKTTGDRPIFDYSLAVARGWKIGSKEDDNPSALLLVAIDDRKYFTQVSKDLEDELPDGVVGSLQRQYLVPEFRKGNYGKGISDTIDAYISAIRNKGNIATPGPQKPEIHRSPSGGSGISGTTICCGAIILIILIMIFSRRGGGPRGSGRSGWNGGGFGGSALPWIVGSILTSGSGGGSSSDWGSSSGGGDWGGFGGGGDFGGGGAGGDW
ncbi:MAG: YgcG family protein [Pyrinomonadaceae bacterium]